MSDSTIQKTKRTAAPQDLLSFEKNTKAFIHRGLILSSIGLALFQCLYGAELSCESLKQGLSDTEGLEHPFVDWSQLPVDLDLLTVKTKVTTRVALPTCVFTYIAALKPTCGFCLCLFVIKCSQNYKSLYWVYLKHQSVSIQLFLQILKMDSYIFSYNSWSIKSDTFS